MIGTDLGLDLPSLSDSLSTIVSKLVTALSAVEDSIADKATPVALDLSSNLSFGGNHATNLGGIVLADGNAPTTAGSIYYQGGEFYAHDATGIIKLTDAGGINVAATGAIGGDYGSGNENVYYDLASQQYRFYADTGVWADLVADDVVLMEDSGTDYVRLTAPADVTTSYDVTFGAAAPGSQQLVQMTDTGQLVYSNVVPNSVTVQSSITATSAVKGTAFLHTNTRPLQIPSMMAHEFGGSTATQYSYKWVFGASTVSSICFPITLCEGDRIVSWSLELIKNSSGSNTIQAYLYRIDTSGTGATVQAAATNSANAPGLVYVSQTLTSVETITIGYQYQVIVVQSTATAGDELLNLSVEYDHPT